MYFGHDESKNTTLFSSMKNGRVTLGKALEKWKTGKFKRRQK
jgi:basic membrane lipoprotein Med (substrate-binding protein (PBP1-ABC) superfamily)